MTYAIRVPVGTRPDLDELPTRVDGGLTKIEGAGEFDRLHAELRQIQTELFAAKRHALLVVLQGLDTSGKDGASSKVLAGVNPIGTRVFSFGVPTPEELSRDFLWRIHRDVPAKGQITFFNRSQYEDVVVARVHELVPAATWQQRFEQINEFERLLTSTGMIVRKFFLHISREEQAKRLRAREEHLEKSWKISASDWRDRKHWDDFIEAYEDAIERCNTDDAPWYVVPADKKWFRNLAICEVIVDALQEHREEWRQALKDLRQQKLAELAKHRH